MINDKGEAKPLSSIENAVIINPMDFQYAFLDPSLPLKKRVGDLVSRLTVEEKAGFIPTKNQAVQRLGVPAWSIGGEGAHGFVDREGQNTAFPQTIGLAAGWDRELLRKIGG
ncbi:MAG: hypothetical protein FWH38_01720, partial [Treponema sp.]|nr:hypothetical protein [Treponema sp.]